MKSQCFLVLTARRNREGVVASFQISRATQKLPDIKSNQARVQLLIEVDPTIFEAEAIAVTVKPTKLAIGKAQARSVE
jgi:hypothetical protein